MYKDFIDIHLRIDVRMTSQNHEHVKLDAKARVNYKVSVLILWMLGNFLKIDYIVVCFLKALNSACVLLEIMD